MTGAALSRPGGRGWWALFCAVAAALAALPLFASPYDATLLIAYALLALSLGLVWGMGGILCFGQGAFFGLGAYAWAVAAINFSGHAWGTPAALALALAIPGLCAALLGALMFYGRIGDVYLAVITLVVTLILFKYLNAASGPGDVIGRAALGGFNGIPDYPLPALGDPAAPWLVFGGDALYYPGAACLLAAWWAARRFLHSSPGRILQGIRENGLRAQLLGYDVRRYKTGVFAAGGALAGLAGMLYAAWAEIVTPGLFSLGQSAEVIVWVLVGGRAALLGPMAGAALLGGTKMLLASQGAINNQALTGAILLAAVLAFPQGIVPALAALAKRLSGLRVPGWRRAGAPAGAANTGPGRRRRHDAA